MQIFEISPKKYPSFERANSTLAQMALSSNYYPLKVQRLEIILALTTAPKVHEWQSYGNFWKVTQNPHFLKKCKGETKTNFCKILKKEPWLQRANRTLAQMSLSSNLDPLIVQRPKKIFGRKEAPKAPEWPSYSNFRKVTQNPHFLKNCKGGTKGHFSKIAQNVALASKGQNHSGANGIIL